MAEIVRPLSIPKANCKLMLAKASKAVQEGFCCTQAPTSTESSPRHYHVNKDPQVDAVHSLQLECLQVVALQ